MTVRRSAVVAFAAVALAHLALLAADAGVATSLTKALLMPTLVAWVVAVDGPRLLLAALWFSWVGDVALEIDSLFLVGMAGFALAHVCYITLFVRSGALGRLRSRPYVPVVGVVVWVALIAWLWAPLGDADASLRVPIVVYSLLLTTTAVLAFGISTWTGVGGALFLASDTLIAVGLTDLPQPPAADLAVMITYLLAQAMLAGAIVTNRRRSVQPADARQDAVQGSVG